MKVTRSLLLVGLAAFALTGCVSTQAPSSASLLAATPAPTPHPDASSIPTFVIHATPTPLVQTIKGKKPMTATTVDIKTDKGIIEIQLFPQDAPKTVENFATLASQGYYNGITFHRVEPGFVIQGGDPNGNGTGGKSIFGDTFEDELNPNTQSYKDGYKEGVVAMANRGPNTNGSQFFIMLADNTTLPHAYTIFGKVVKGLDVVHQIAVGDKMESITIVK